MKMLFFRLFLSLAVGAAELPAKSIYQLDQVWTDQDGKSVNLKEFAGTPAVVTMTYTGCPGSCPLMVSDIRGFDKMLSGKEKKKIHYFTFSIDSIHDTPEALKKFYTKMHLDKRWTLLTAPAGQITEMAALLGFSYKDLGNGDFTHSTSLYLLSSGGEILARKERSSDWKDFLEKLRAELKR